MICSAYSSAEDVVVSVHGTSGETSVIVMWVASLCVMVSLGALLAYLIRLIKPYCSAMLARVQGRLPGGPPSYP